mgnify:FL=1
MTYKQEYSSITHVGATPEDCKVIHLALMEGKKLSIDKNGRIIDETGRWNADGKERSNG